MHDILLKTTEYDDWTAQLLFMESYDQGYGIFDHDTLDIGRPLSIIAMHPAEDHLRYSRMRNLMREVISCRIPELTQTPLLDVLNFPRDVLDELLKDGRKARDKTTVEIETLESKLRQE